MKLWGVIKSNIICECVIGPFEIPNTFAFDFISFLVSSPPSTTHIGGRPAAFAWAYLLLLLIIMQYVLLLALKRRIWKVVVLWRRRRPCWTWGLSLLLLINNNADNDDPAHPSSPSPSHPSILFHPQNHNLLIFWPCRVLCLWRVQLLLEQKLLGLASPRIGRRMVLLVLIWFV